MVLLETGVSFKSRDQGGRTVVGGWPGACDAGQSLLEKGADFESRDQSGRTPLSWAADDGHEAVLSLLLEKGFLSRRRVGIAISLADTLAPSHRV
jgi:hypothetical protein